MPIHFPAPGASRFEARKLTLVCLAALASACIDSLSAQPADGPAKEVGLPLEGKEKPQLVRDPGGHTAAVRAAFFHPGGDNVITVSADKTVRLWDLASGDMMHVFRLPIGPGNEGALQAGDISSDGRLLAVGGVTAGDGKFGDLVYLIDIESNQVGRTPAGHTNYITCLAFSHDNRLLASASADRTARLFDVQIGKTAHVLKGHAGNLRKIAFSHDDKYVATTSVDGTARIWSAVDGKPMIVLKDIPGGAISVAWHPKEALLATGSADSAIQVWKADGAPIEKVKLQDPYPLNIVALAFSPDGGELLYGGISTIGRVGIYNRKDGKERLKFTRHTNTVLDARFSADGKLAITAGGDNHETYIWKVADGTVVQKLQGSGQSVWALGWRLDGKAFAWGSTNAAANSPLEHTFSFEEMQLGAKSDEHFGRLSHRHGPWEVKRSAFTRLAVRKDGVLLYEHESKFNRIYSFSLLAKERVVIGAAHGLYVLDLPTNKILRTFRGHGDIIAAVSPSPDGRYILTGSLDQTISLWNQDREDPVVTFFAAGREWIAWTPEGYYACSPYGERLIGWQINNGFDKVGTFHPADRFRNSLYQPNLVRYIFQEKSLEKALVLASEAGSEPVRPVSVAQVLPPAVNLVAPSGAHVTTTEAAIEVKARARSTGGRAITAMRVLVDGRPYLGDKGLKKFDPPRQGAVEATWTVELLPGKHSIAVIAESAVSKGTSSWTEVTRAGVKTEELPSLYLVAAGISAYEGPLALNFAHKDAIVLDRTLRAGRQGVFRTVETKLLTDKRATRKNILAGLGWLQKKMTAKDVAILFLGGHGARDERGQFLFIPVDVESDNLEKTAVGGDLLKKELANLPGRVVVLLDACHSGAASGRKKPIADDLVRDLVSDGVGIVVMCSSQGQEYSLESIEVAHGLFTLALVEALAGRADFNKDGYIYIHEIDYYTSQRVRQLSDGRQNPATGRPQHLRTFPLAKVK
jgi:WD40 repeat protein